MENRRNPRIHFYSRRRTSVKTIFGSQGSSLNMNLENFIEETKQSLRHCDECLSTSDLNANLETSNENTRERKFLSKLNQKIAKRNCSDPRSEEESHRRLYSSMSRMANDERQRSRQFIEAILSQATKGIR